MARKVQAIWHVCIVSIHCCGNFLEIFVGHIVQTTCRQYSAFAKAISIFYSWISGDELAMALMCKWLSSGSIKLPPRDEITLLAGISETQKKLYKALLMKNVDALLPHARNKSSTLNLLMQLRKCSNHPYLFDGMFARYMGMGFAARIHSAMRPT